MIFIARGSQESNMFDCDLTKFQAPLKINDPKKTERVWKTLDQLSVSRNRHSRSKSNESMTRGLTDHNEQAK